MFQKRPIWLGCPHMAHCNIMLYRNKYMRNLIYRIKNIAQCNMQCNVLVCWYHFLVHSKKMRFENEFNTLLCPRCLAPSSSMSSILHQIILTSAWSTWCESATWATWHLYSIHWLNWGRWLNPESALPYRVPADAALNEHCSKLNLNMFVTPKNLPVVLK